MPLEKIVRHVRRWPRRLVITLAVVAVLLVGARAALPHVVKSQINARLQAIPGYKGNVEDVGISLFRGAYSLGGIAIFRDAGRVREPFFLCKEIDFSIAWRELFRGKIVSDIYLDAPQVNFVQAAADTTSQTDADKRWVEVIQDIFPVDITHFEIRNGAVRYIDKTKAPHVDVFVKNLQAYATGLRNQPGEHGAGEFPAKIDLEGDTLGAGKLRVSIAADPLAVQPHFHLSATVNNVNLPALNDELKAIANVDVGKGTFRMAAEMAGKDGGFQGYVKPFFEHLDFRNIEDKQKGLGSRLWEKVVTGLAWLVKNKSRDQVGTRIPFQGEFGDPKLGLWSTIANTFRHGFIRAFNPTVEGTVRAANILPSGKSADGRDVGEVKDERRDKRSAETSKSRETETRAGAGAPTGRESRTATPPSLPPK